MADAANTPTSKRLQFIEPFYVQDIIVSDIADVEEISPNLFRVAFYTTGKCMIDGGLERVISAKLVMSGETLAQVGINHPAARKRASIRLKLPQ